MSRLLLNCDIGESYGAWTMGLDAEVMPYIDCANIACGFHAGDTVRFAPIDHAEFIRSGGDDTPLEALA